ncbi:MAG: class I adenylate-forming enzyme family protein [Pseudomonadota bacterium]
MERVEHFLSNQLLDGGAHPAISDSLGVSWSYAELNVAADALADHLRTAGVRGQDRVLLLAENCAAAVAALFACWKLDAVAIPVNARQTETEVLRILDHATPAVILATSAVSQDALTHADRFGAQVITGAFGRMHLCLRQPAPDPHLEGVAVLLYTTGTTGDPKGVMLTHSGMCFGGIASSNLRNMTRADVVYGVLPLTHVFGLISVVTGVCYAGAHLRQETRFSAEALYKAVTDNVTVLPAVPQMHALAMQYVEEKGLTQLKSNTLRYVSSGGAPLDPAWKRKAEAFYGLALQNGFGMTETSSGASATNNPLGSSDISVGPPTPGTEIAIDDQAPGGNGAGEGEVLVRGPHVMKGYYRNPVETAKTLMPDGWLRTGDLGKIDARGHLHILGRSKELIIHGGFNVYPPEVEAAINDHPQVIQSAVIGHVQEGDEKVFAFVQIAPSDSLSSEALHAFVKERLVGYKRPSRYIIAVALPAAPTGKVLKHKLKETFADQLV